MKVELAEYPEGLQRFEVFLGDVCHIISLERAKELADDIYKLHPTCKAENEALKSRDFYQGVFIEQVLKTDPRWEETKAYKELQVALLTWFRRKDVLTTALEG